MNENPSNYYFQSLVLHASGRFTFCNAGNYNPTPEDIIECKPRYQVGDKLWVKETFLIANTDTLIWQYKADTAYPENYKWKSSLFMPKKAARIWLEVTGVRCERLHDITEADAIAEGIEKINLNEPFEGYKEYFINGCTMGVLPIDSFHSLWMKINGVESMQSNPLVFIYEFKKIEKKGIPWKHYTYHYHYKSAHTNNIFIGGSKTTMQDEDKIIESEGEAFRLFCAENKVTPIEYTIFFEK